MQDEIRRINDLALWDFEVARRDGDRVLILGSNDFVYGHYLEAEFGGVVFCNLPDTFSHAEFLPGREDDVTTIWVHVPDEGKDFEIRAATLEVRLGRVSYTRR